MVKQSDDLEDKRCLKAEEAKECKGWQDIIMSKDLELEMEQEDNDRGNCGCMNGMLTRDSSTCQPMARGDKTRS